MAQPEWALALYEQALIVAQETKERPLEVWALIGCMQSWQARAQPQVAIFYGKLAVNVVQTLRADLRRLAPELQQSFLHSMEWAYRSLAELLISEGRLPEAQQVLELLKEREFFDFVRRDASVGTLHGQAAWTPTEATWAARYRIIADRLATVATEYGALRHKPGRTTDDTQRLGALEADLGVARQAFEQFLATLQVEVRQTPQVQERLARLTEESQGLMDALRDLGPGTVALYTLVTGTAYHVILTTPEVQLARQTPLAAADLARAVHAFREALDPARPGGLRRDPRPLARELYQLLVAPIAQDLQQAQATTLMWSLDGVLRYLPLAALHDGEQYLLERYRLAVFTPASATRLKDQPQRPWQGMGFGVSKAHAGFSALPTVPDELRSIIRDTTQRNPAGVLPGRIHLDEAFTDTALRMALHERYPVVHIASHFQLHPGDDTASFLLLGDGSHLPLAQLKTWPQPFQGVELLTLSACNTAVGSAGAEGKEVEGLAVLAQRQGAKAVVATLWAVADTSTQALMQTFYRLRESQPGLPKVEALRQAQLALLRGTGPSGAVPPLAARGLVLSEGARSGPGEALPPFVPEAQAPYAHPAYWAPFVLIGNWR
jgi:CHAT domain-containing protein